MNMIWQLANPVFDASNGLATYLPPAYVVRREGNSFTLLVCSHLGGGGVSPAVGRGGRVRSVQPGGGGSGQSSWGGSGQSSRGRGSGQSSGGGGQVSPVGGSGQLAGGGVSQDRTTE